MDPKVIVIVLIAAVVMAVFAYDMARYGLKKPSPSGFVGGGMIALTGVMLYVENRKPEAVGPINQWLIDNGVTGQLTILLIITGPAFVGMMLIWIAGELRHNYDVNQMIEEGKRRVIHLRNNHVAGNEALVMIKSIDSGHHRAEMLRSEFLARIGTNETELARFKDEFGWSSWEGRFDSDAA